MLRKFGLLLVVFGFGGSNLSFAEGDPLSETQALLTNPSARQAIMNSDPAAKQAGDRVKALGLGAAGEEEVYRISSELTGSLVREAGGDAGKLNEKVNLLLRNPAALEKELSPEQKKRIHDLSSEIESSQSSNKPIH